MNKEDIIRKITSRRLWVAVAGIVTGVALALGGEASEIQSLAGAITAVLSALGYMVTEAKVDRARVASDLIFDAIQDTKIEEGTKTDD